MRRSCAPSSGSACPASMTTWPAMSLCTQTRWRRPDVGSGWGWTTTITPSGTCAVSQPWADRSDGGGPMCEISLHTSSCGEQSRHLILREDDGGAIHHPPIYAAMSSATRPSDVSRQRRSPPSIPREAAITGATSARQAFAQLALGSGAAITGVRAADTSKGPSTAFPSSPTRALLRARSPSTAGIHVGCPFKSVRNRATWTAACHAARASPDGSAFTSTSRTRPSRARPTMSSFRGRASWEGSPTTPGSAAS